MADATAKAHSTGGHAMISKKTTAMLTWCQDYNVTYTALLRLLVRGNSSYSNTIRALHTEWRHYTR